MKEKRGERQIVEKFRKKRGEGTITANYWRKKKIRNGHRDDVGIKKLKDKGALEVQPLDSHWEQLEGGRIKVTRVYALRRGGERVGRCGLGRRNLKKSFVGERKQKSSTSRPWEPKCEGTRRLAV